MDTTTLSSLAETSSSVLIADNSSKTTSVEKNASVGTLFCFQQAHPIWGTRAVGASIDSLKVTAFQGSSSVETMNSCQALSTTIVTFLDKDSFFHSQACAFGRFSTFSTGIRLRIWKFALPDPWVIKIDWRCERTVKQGKPITKAYHFAKSDSPPIALLEVSSEARETAQKDFRCHFSKNFYLLILKTIFHLIFNTEFLISLPHTIYFFAVASY